MIIAWGICAILTVADVLPRDPGKWGYEARTDRRNDILISSKWFRVPYPGKCIATSKESVMAKVTMIEIFSEHPFSEV